jgi:hypothetical protein
VIADAALAIAARTTKPGARRYAGILSATAEPYPDIFPATRRDA